MKIAARVALTLLLVAYGAMLIRDASFAAGGSDSSGYLNEARMIRRGHAVRPIRSLSQLHIGSSWAGVFTPLGFVPWDKDARFMVPTYPPGLPLQFAIAGTIGGFMRAPFLIPPLAGVISLILMMILGRQLGLTKRESLAATAILAATAVFIYYAAQPMSDTVAAAWTLAMIVLALAGSPSPGPATPARPLPRGEVPAQPLPRGEVTAQPLPWGEVPAQPLPRGEVTAQPLPRGEVPAQPLSRGEVPARPLPRGEVAAKRRVRGSFAAAAGAAFAISVCVRPSNLLMAIPLAVAMRFRMRSLLLAAAAALPIGIALMLWNHILYGSYFSTGYGSMRDLLAWGYPRQRLPHYSYWLAAQLSPLVFPFGLIADRKNRALIIAWFVPLFAFYCFYDSYDAWWYTRFLLPVIPPLIVGFILLIRRWRFWPIAIPLVLAVAIWQDWRVNPLTVGADESIYTETMHWVAPQLPRDAIVIANQFSGTFLYYQDRETVRSDWLDDNRFQELRAYAGAANLRWYAVLMQGELAGFHLRGKWTPVSKNRDVILLRLDD